MYFFIIYVIIGNNLVFWSIYMEWFHTTWHDRAWDILKMNFQPNDVQHHLETAMKLALEDGKISQEEWNALLSRFKNQAQEVFLFLQSNQQQLREFSQTQFFALQEDFSCPVEEKNISEFQASTTRSEMAKQFFIEKSDTLLLDIGFDIDQVYSYYDQKIQTFASTLSPEECRKLYQAIANKITTLLSYVHDIKKRNEIYVSELTQKKETLEYALQYQKQYHLLDEIVAISDTIEANNFKNQRWILNEYIQEEFSFLNEKLFPSIELYIKHEKLWEPIPEKYTKVTRNARRNTNPHFIRVNSKFSAVETFLASEIDEEGNFDAWFFTQYQLFDVWHKNDAALLGDFDIKGENISFLNEADKQIEADVTIKYLACCIASCTPYLWATLSLPSDTLDAFSSSDWILTLMKSMNMVPQEYQMSKSWWDNLMWIFWLVWSLGWIQGLAKSPKILKITQKLQNLGISSDQIWKKVQEFVTIFQQKLFPTSKTMKQSENVDPLSIGKTQKLKIQSSPSSQPEELSEAFKIELEKIGGASAYKVEQILKMQKAFERTQISPQQLIENSKWLKNNTNLPNEILSSSWLPELTPIQYDMVKYIHEKVSAWLWKNESKNLRDMKEITNTVGITKDQVRVLTENGILWQLDIASHRNAHIHFLNRMKMVWKYVLPEKLPTIDVLNMPQELKGKVAIKISDMRWNVVSEIWFDAAFQQQNTGKKLVETTNKLTFWSEQINGKLVSWENYTVSYKAYGYEALKSAVWWVRIQQPMKQNNS